MSLILSKFCSFRKYSLMPQTISITKNKQKHNNKKPPSKINHIKNFHKSLYLSSSYFYILLLHLEIITLHESVEMIEVFIKCMQNLRNAKNVPQNTSHTQKSNNPIITICHSTSKVSPTVNTLVHLNVLNQATSLMLRANFA